MHISQFLVCFFLSMSVSGTPVSYSVETLEQRARVCTRQEATRLSYDCSQAYQEKTSQIFDLENQLEEIEEGQKRAQVQYEKSYQLYQLEKERCKLKLVQAQLVYPHKFEIANSLDVYYEDFLQQKDKVDAYQKEKEHLVLNYEKIQNEIQRIQNVQDNLQKRFPVHFDTLQNDPQEDSKMQGWASVQPYGSYLQEQLDSSFSCLTSDMELQSSSSLEEMIPSAWMSAGTWSYPEGGMHLGMDLASDLYTPIYAPCNGVILYADAPCQDNSGYLGNREGWPDGGGNTMAMLISLQDQLYAITLAHLSSTLYVSSGQQIHPGDVLALSGNSGNSTGPHTHIEVFEIHVSLQEAIEYFQRTADFSFGCGFDAPEISSVYATRIRPELFWEGV